MERFLQHGRGSVATVYGPISFPPQPVLLFREDGDGMPALVATGACLRFAPPGLLWTLLVQLNEGWYSAY